MTRAATGLFGGIYATGESAAALSDQAWLQAMLDVEAALARTGAAAGTIPAAGAQAIGEACRAERFDLDQLGREAARHASPVVPLVRALRDAVGDPHAEHVHRGATSQDVIDTAMMLVVRRAGQPLSDDAAAAGQAAAALARAHAGTAMTGRTLLQPALPVSFGLVAAGWAQGISQALSGWDALIAGGLPVQLGGPVGSGPPELAAGVAAELGLAEPVLPWHTNRVLPASLGAALGVLAGALGKVARDVTLLAGQGEVREGGGGERGASSAMAHKHNPVAAVSVLACAKRTPGLVGSMLAAMEQEHQRAAGAWQSEWGALTELISLTASAASWSRELLEELEIDVERMGANLAASGVPQAGKGGRGLGAAEELIARVGERMASRSSNPSPEVIHE